MVLVSVIYPKTSESRFDLDYYIQKHMPLVRSRWSGMGLERDQLLHGTSALNSGPPTYELIAILTFSSKEHLQNALAQGGNEILGDIPNFTDVQPVLQINDLL